MLIGDHRERNRHRNQPVAPYFQNDPANYAIRILAESLATGVGTFRNDAVLSTGDPRQ